MSGEGDWSADANEAVEVSLVAPSSSGLQTLAKFHPKFTYPIFGEQEQIFGYKKLKISLAYNASDMRPHLTVSHSDKFKAVGETEATDIDGVLHEFLPEVAFQKRKDFETAINNVPSGWTPPGKLVSSFNTSKNGTFEVWKGSLEDPAVKQVVKRIQIFVPFYIEGGTCIRLDDEDADRWTVFFLYQKKPFPGESDRFSYVFAGYSTAYRFFLFHPQTPPASPSGSHDIDLSGNFDLMELPCRSRISQFMIIPPFQAKGLGPVFYSTIFDQYLKHPQTVEITVEDPNEAFDDMRDVSDLRFLRQMPEFAAIRINTNVVIDMKGPAPNNIVDTAACEAIRRKTKIAPRQFWRVVEMYLMSKLPEAVRPGFNIEKAPRATKEQQHELDLWRLLAKKRIYRQNKDALGALDARERIEKLTDTVLSVEFDYARLLNKALVGDKNVAVGALNGKRKLEESGEPSASKKARMEDA